MTLPLVLIPGFMLDETLWDEVVAELPKDLPIIRASLTHGDTIQAMARAILARAPARFIAVGFSLGGYVARAITEAAPERIAGLVLVGSSLRSDTATTRAAKLTAINAMASGSFHGLSRKTIAQTLHPGGSNREQWVDRLQAMSKNLGFEQFKIQSSLDRDKITRRAVTSPTLIIASAEDPLRPLEETRELHAAFPDADCELIHGIGHMIPLEAPQALAEKLTAFCARIND